MRRKNVLIAFLLVLALPALAVFKEKDIKLTLEVLLGELRTEYAGITARNTSLSRRISSQHKKLVKQVEQSNELSLMLYSQPQDYMFDLTYALHQATRQYEEFEANRMPFDQIIDNLSTELDRYSKLVQTLRNMPPVIQDSLSFPVESLPVLDSLDMEADTLMGIPLFALREGFTLDSESRTLRDSCYALADAMVMHYLNTIQIIQEDSSYYEDTDKVLKEAYDYAQGRYEGVQKKVFLEGQGSYFKVLGSFDRYWNRAVKDLSSKYARNSEGMKSAWKGPAIAVYSAVMLLLLLFSILLARLLVKFTMRWVKYFRSYYFQEHKKMVTTLIGVVIFSFFVLGSAFVGDGFFPFASQLMAEFTVLLATMILSHLIRLDDNQGRTAMSLYMPTLILAFIVIFFRIIFIPNSALNLFFPPLVLGFFICQMLANRKKMSQLPKQDRILMRLSALVMAAATVLSWFGLVMMAVLVLNWWFFQLTLLQAIMALSVLVERHNKNCIVRRQANYRQKNPGMPLTSAKGSFIEITWLYDLMKMVVIPVMGIWSLPLAIMLAGDVFNLRVVVAGFFFSPLVNIEGALHLSIAKLIIVISLFFVAQYLVYAGKSFYRVIRTRSVIKKLGEGVVFKESDINFNLANNIITLLVWGIYVMTIFIMHKIPTSALTIITTGLATGIGFAMKDVLNNFFYGVQLMGGRVRVGDTIECDGIRGMVQSLSYQSTQVASEDGAVVAFSNTALFNKNFKNLTRNHQYEMINFLVSVRYGEDVQKVRKVILEALQPLLGKDKYGHDVIDMKKGIAVRFRNFGESAIDVQVLLFATVEAHYSFAAQAKEAIYNAFEANGIEIPYPQRDVHIKDHS